MSKYLDLAIRLAHQAGDLLLSYYQSGELQTELKSDRSVVTQADVAADHLISAGLRDSFPEESILSEELQPRYTSSETQPVPAVWVVDPLDGTTNFSLGLPFWGVSIARLVKGRPETAILYFPVVQELYTAQRGQGAFLNNQPLHIPLPDKDRPLPFFACCSRTFRHYQIKIPYKIRILGSAAYTFCMVARGAAILGFESTPKIWDLAAAWLLIQEAGGIIEPLNGNNPFPLRSGVPYHQQSFPTLAAGDPNLVAKAHLEIIPR